MEEREDDLPIQSHEKHRKLYWTIGTERKMMTEYHHNERSLEPAKKITKKQL